MELVNPRLSPMLLMRPNGGIIGTEKVEGTVPPVPPSGTHEVKHSLRKLWSALPWLRFQLFYLEHENVFDYGFLVIKNKSLLQQFPLKNFFSVQESYPKEKK